jgi:hypothetical protein
VRSGRGAQTQNSDRCAKILLILATMLVLALPRKSWSQFTYTTNNGAITITGYTGPDSIVTIPSTINGYPVAAIGANAFSNQDAVSDVTIPNSVIDIGDGAFINCSGLTSVTFGNSVTNIGEQAFYECYGLTSVTIPAGVTTIGKDAFAYNGLTNITVNAANPNYASAGGVLFNKAMTALIQCPAGLAGSYTIPNSVINIGEDAFYDCYHLTNVTIADSVASIGDWAFFLCYGLTSVTFPDSLTSIGNYAFYQCSGLTSLTIGNRVATIGTEAFYDCPHLTIVTIPDSVTSIGSDAFTYCRGLTNIVVSAGNPSYASSGGVLFNKAMTTLIQCPQGLADLVGSYAIPNGVTNVGDGAFVGSSGLTPGLTNVAIPDSVTSIGNAAFSANYGLKSITIPNSVVSIGNYAFSHCPGLTNVTIGSSLTSIGDWAFLGCSGLMSVTFPYSLTTIGDAAFVGCSGLTSVTIPDGVTNIGNTAFSSCPGLTNISVYGANPGYASAGGVLFNKTLTALIRCPEGLAGGYTIPDSVTTVGNSAFLHCSSLTNVMIGNSVSDIGTEAFYLCSGLTSMTIPNSVTSIGNYAFSYCTRLHQAYFRGNAPSVNGGAGSTNTTVFFGESGTAYFLPSATGWGATFGGWPAVAGSYQPQPQILAPVFSPGALSNGFRFTIFWATNANVVVEASTNLQSWTPVITNALVNGVDAFRDSTWTNYPRRFYRVRSQ